jgi:hypothetical protein
MPNLIFGADARVPAAHKPRVVLGRGGKRAPVDPQDARIPEVRVAGEEGSLVADVQTLGCAHRAGSFARLQSSGSPSLSTSSSAIFSRR